MKNEPPAEIKGKGKPLTGINPTVIAVFTNTCANNIEANPMRIRLENLSFERNEDLIVLLIK